MILMYGNTLPGSGCLLLFLQGFPPPHFSVLGRIALFLKIRRLQPTTFSNKRQNLGLCYRAAPPASPKKPARSENQILHHNFRQAFFRFLYRYRDYLDSLTGCLADSFLFIDQNGPHSLGNFHLCDLVKIRVRNHID